MRLLEAERSQIGLVNKTIKPESNKNKGQIISNKQLCTYRKLNKNELIPNCIVWPVNDLSN